MNSRQLEGTNNYVQLFPLHRRIEYVVDSLVDILD